jgi:hypothetical protein
MGDEMYGRRARWQYFTGGLEQRVSLCFFDNAVIFFDSEAAFRNKRITNARHVFLNAV